MAAFFVMPRPFQGVQHQVFGVFIAVASFSFYPGSSAIVMTLAGGRLSAVCALSCRTGNAEETVIPVIFTKNLPPFSILQILETLSN